MGCPGIPSKSGSEFASPKLGCCHCFMMFHDEFIGVQGSAETSNNSERSHDSRNRFSTSEDCNIWEIGNYHVCIYIWRTIHFLFGLVGICYEINVLSWPSCRMSAESTLSTIISVGSSGFHQQWRIPQNNKFGGVKNDRPSDFHWNLNWWAATDLTAVDVLPLVNVNHFLRWISRWTYRFDILLTKVSSGWEGAKGVSV